MRSKSFSLSVGLAVLLLAPALARAGIVIAAGDEWATSNDAFAFINAPTSAYVTNLDNFIGGSNYLIYTNVGSFAYGSSFAAKLTSLGNTVTSIAGTTAFSTISLASYSAVFIAGNTNGADALDGPSALTQLNDYVNSGGAVYVSLGTGGFGNSVQEAAAWNPFLNSWGLTAGNTWFDGTGVVVISTLAGSHPLRQGVNQIEWGFGQSISEINPADPNTDIAITGIFGGALGNQPVVGVYAPLTAVPEPSSLALLIAGSLTLGCTVRRRRSKS